MDLTRRAFALGSLGLLGAACSSSSGATHSAPASKLVQVRSGTARRVALGSLTAKELADAQRSFGVDLLGKVCTSGENTTISPASAALALGLLTAGARGDTEKKLSAMLHLPRWGDAVVAAYGAQHAQLASFRDQLQVSNRCYTANGNDPEKQTLDDWATGFDADLTQLDIEGHPKESTNRINADVSKDTTGLIPHLFDKPLDPSVNCVLVNALHLKADWADPFTKESTTATTFTKADGSTVKVQMMSGAHGAFREKDDWQSVTLGYAGGHLEMVAILPPAREGCEQLTPALLNALSRTDSSLFGELSMPKLEQDQTHHLIRDLKALGFPDTGNYSGLGFDDTVTDVVQKIVLKVDEKGTEAAAATAISVVGTSAQTAVHVVRLDRPYFLLLQDVETGTPLFLSHIVDPTA